MTRSPDTDTNLRPIPRRVVIALTIAIAAAAASCAGTSGAERRSARQAAFVEISGGEQHLCGLRRNGSASCFQIEANPAESPAPATTTAAGMPLDVGDAFDDIVAIVAGRDRSCAIRSDRTLACVAHVDAIPLVTPSGISDAIAVGMGSMHLAVVRPDQVIEVYDLRDGQLALPTRRTAQGHLELAETPLAAELGSRFGCAATGAGHAYCWGSNWGGECGNGGDGLEFEPVAVAPALAFDSPEVARAFEGCEPSCEGVLEGVLQVDVRGRTACALLEQRGVACWGESAAGAFLPSDADPSFSRRPVMLAGTEGASDLCVGRAHVCAVRDDAVICRGEPEFASSARAEVDALHGSVAIACTTDSVCGLRGDGTIRCEGSAGSLRLR